MSEEQASSLPDLQPLADSLEGLAQGDWVQLLTKVDEQLSSVNSAEQALSTLKERAGELLQAVEDLKSEREAATLSIQTMGHDFSAESENWQSTLKEAGSSLQDSSTTLKSKLRDLTRQSTDQIEQVRSSMVEQMHAGHLRKIEESATSVADGVRDARSKADALAGDLVTKAQNELHQLEQRAKDDLTSEIEQQAKQRFATEAGRLGEEVVNNLVLSQASVAITGAVTPILPQLVALKAAVGAIKLALHPFG